MDYDQLIQQTADILTLKKKQHLILGNIALQITKEWGSSKLNDFSNDIKETHGITISANTLKNYAWVQERVGHFDLPEDFSYRTLQYIASSGRPKHWAKRIENEGLSSAEVYYLLREEKGLESTTERLVCPLCKGVFNKKDAKKEKNNKTVDPSS